MWSYRHYKTNERGGDGVKEKAWTHEDCLKRGYHRWVVVDGGPVEDQYISVDLYCEDCGATAWCTHSHRVEVKA